MSLTAIIRREVDNLLTKYQEAIDLPGQTGVMISVRAAPDGKIRQRRINVEKE